MRLLPPASQQALTDALDQFPNGLPATDRRAEQLPYQCGNC
jgi:hypothetical protein